MAVFSLCPHMVFTLHTYILGLSLWAQISFSYKNTSQVGLRPTPMTLFNLNYLLKDPISIDSYILKHLELVLQHKNEGGHNSAHNCLPEQITPPLWTLDYS